LCIGLYEDGWTASAITQPDVRMIGISAVHASAQTGTNRAHFRLSGGELDDRPGGSRRDTVRSTTLTMISVVRTDTSGRAKTSDFFTLLAEPVAQINFDETADVVEGALG
jgi:hypothetical protein